MPRLIDAEALSARMYNDAFETDSDMQKWDNGCWIRYKMFENAIADASTVDAVEVVHGHWENYLTEGLRWKCSECGSRYSAPYHYCPHCGAKMDEVKE